jgi:hypothetical protein
MHDVAVCLITTKDVGDNLAKGLWIKSLVYIANGIVDVFLGG